VASATGSDPDLRTQLRTVSQHPRVAGSVTGSSNT